MAAATKVGTLIVEVVHAFVPNDESKAFWDKLKEASVKIELRDGSDVEKRKTKTVARKPTAAGGFECPYGEVFEFDIKPDFPGELRLNLCRVKNSSQVGGSKVLANAGIFVKNLVRYIEKQQSAIYKSFSLFSKDSGKACGAVVLKVNYRPAGMKEYVMPAVPKEAAKPVPEVSPSDAPAAAAETPREPVTPVAAPVDSKVDEALLEDHAVAEVDESKDVVHFAAAVKSGPPLPLLAGGAALLVGALLLVLGGKKAPPPPPPPPPAPPAKGGKK